jgi:UDP-2,3-diacylglucosamine pyrophosphatase LpxH
MNTIILSDLHLGARNSQSGLLLEILNSDFQRLVLNGDTVDSPDSRRFRDRDWKVIELLREVAIERELVVIRGNHDILSGPTNTRGTTRYVSELLGVDVVEEYRLPISDSDYLVVHGDRYDSTMNLSMVGDAADWCYRRIQELSRPLAHWVKGASKSVCGVVDSVRNGALTDVRQRGFAGVITGHTHYCEDERPDGLHYLNTGCWVDWPCTYVGVQNDTVGLRHWMDRPTLVSVPARNRELAAVG